MDTGHKCFSAVVQNSLKASPRVIFLKEPHKQLKLFLKWTLIERWRRPSTLRSMCQHVARLQFDSCAEKCSLCGTVMIHDGLNLRCLDHCHGVRSDGTSSSQGWRTRIVVQSKFDPWAHILVSPKMIYGGLPRKAFSRKQAFVDINAFLWLRKQRPRFAQGQPKGNFQWKELHRTTKAYSQMKADWNWRRPNMLSSMRQHVCRERQPLWNSHDSWYINIFLWLRKQRPRFAQGQPKGNFQLKELQRTTKANSQMNPDWKVEKGQYAEFNVPTCEKIAVWQLCRKTLEQSWFMMAWT